MGKEPTSTLWVCGCCYMALVNGESCEESEDTTQHPVGLMGKLSDCEPTPGMLDHAYGCPNYFHDDDCETIDFSRAQCDGCGSWLGGERHAVIGWIESA